MIRSDIKVNNISTVPNVTHYQVSEINNNSFNTLTTLKRTSQTFQVKINYIGSHAHVMQKFVFTHFGTEKLDALVHHDTLKVSFRRVD